MNNILKLEHSIDKHIMEAITKNPGLQHISQVKCTDFRRNKNFFEWNVLCKNQMFIGRSYN